MNAPIQLIINIKNSVFTLKTILLPERRLLKMGMMLHVFPMKILDMVERDSGLGSSPST